jgi:hypothetical protein
MISSDKKKQEMDEKNSKLEWFLRENESFVISINLKN